MRAFVQLRKISSSHKQLAQKLREIEARLGDRDESIVAIFEVIQQLMSPPETKKRKIYPVQSVSLPSAMISFQNGVSILEPPRVIHSI
jgi:hypothetical protein